MNRHCGENLSMRLLMIWDQQWYIVNALIQIPLAKQTSTAQMSSRVGVKSEGEHRRILSTSYLSKKNQKGHSEMDTRSCLTTSFQSDCPHTFSS